MKRGGRNFRNERGHQVDIDVADWPNGKVMIRVTGPDSSHIYVSEMEAKMLLEALTEWAES